MDAAFGDRYRRGLDPLAMRRDPADDRRLADARPRSRQRRADRLLPVPHRRRRGRAAAARGCSRATTGAASAARCSNNFIDRARAAASTRVHLEVRDGNPAVAMYRAAGFAPVGRRPQILSRDRRQRNSTRSPSPATFNLSVYSNCATTVAHGHMPTLMQPCKSTARSTLLELGIQQWTTMKMPKTLC